MGPRAKGFLRSLNIELCPNVLDITAASHFGLNLSALPRSARVHLCEDRVDAHAGIVYVENLVSASELRDLRALEDQFTQLSTNKRDQARGPDDDPETEHFAHRQV